VYRWIDHTAEVELAISAVSEEEVLADAVLALAELLGFAGAEPTSARQVVAAGTDRPALLAAWLEELVYLAESEGFVGLGVDWLALREGSVSASVQGAVGDPPPLVKAVTYHRLEFARSGSGYLANVVLDV
jgi:SHS2 domain-containing protein